MLHKKFSQDLATWLMWNKKFVYVLNYLKIFKAVPKNNPRTHSPKQNKKAVLTTAAYFKVSKSLGCFHYKTEKVNTTTEFCTFELV